MRRAAGEPGLAASSCLSLPLPADMVEGGVLAELAEPGEYARALDLTTAAGAAGTMLAEIAGNVLIACRDDAALRSRWCDYRSAGHDVSALLATPERLPLASENIDVAVWELPLDDVIVCRPALNELHRVLAPSGALIVVGVPSGQRQATAATGRSTASLCRVLEEHGFVVDTAVTTRHGRQGAQPSALTAPDHPPNTPFRTRVVHEPATAHGRDLLRFAWPATVVRARKPGVRGYLDP